MQQPQLVVQLPDSNTAKKTGSFLWLWVVLAMALSGAGGWFGREALEGRDDLAQHAAALKPFLAYNRDYDEMSARATNDDIRMVSFHIYQARKEGLDLREVLDVAMPVEQVPPNLKSLTTDRLIENHQQAIDYGLYSADNLAALSMGKCSHHY